MEKPDYPWYIVVSDFIGNTADKLAEWIIDGLGEYFRWWD